MCWKSSRGYGNATSLYPGYFAAPRLRMTYSSASRGRRVVVDNRREDAGCHSEYPIARRALRAGKEPPAQPPSRRWLCGLRGAAPLFAGQSGALAPHSTTLARSAEYHAESPQLWSAPRQRRFPTVAGEKFGVRQRGVWT